MQFEILEITIVTCSKLFFHSSVVWDSVIGVVKNFGKVWISVSVMEPASNLLWRADWEEDKSGNKDVYTETGSGIYWVALMVDWVWYGSSSGRLLFQYYYYYY